MQAPRLPTHIWVAALVRTVQLGGASAFVLHKGDAERGDVLIKVARLDGTAHAFVPSFDAETGERTFIDIALRGVEPAEAAIDAYIERARTRDRDLWVVEIEDRAGRHFLTERVEMAPETS